MKLKFRPSIDGKRQQNESNNQYGKPAPVEETASTGKGMLVVAFILLIAILTVFFQSLIDKKHNPNQSVNSYQNEHGQIVVQLTRNVKGHYVSSGEINGVPVTFLLDTGATDVAIPLHFQNHLGLEKGPPIRLSTANGSTTGYQTRLYTLSIGEIKLRNVKAILTPNLENILLGMSALKQIEFSQKGNVLTLKQ